jgi:hypothetical protein
VGRLPEADGGGSRAPVPAEGGLHLPDMVGMAHALKPCHDNQSLTDPSLKRFVLDILYTDCPYIRTSRDNQSTGTFCPLPGLLKVETNENGSGLWKVAIDRHLVRIVVIDVHFYFYLAAILE